MAITRLPGQYVGGITPLAYPNNNTAGNFLVCVFRGSTLSTVTDTNLNSGWTKAVAVVNGSSGVNIWFCPNCKVGANSVIVAGSLDQICIGEYSGLALTSVLGQTNGATSGSSTYAAGSILTTNANDLLIGAVSNEGANSNTDTPTGGFTDRVNQAGNVFLADQIVSSNGTYSYGGTYSLIASFPTAAAVAAFLGAASAPSGGPGTGSPPFGWVNTQGDHYNKRGLR